MLADTAHVTIETRNTPPDVAMVHPPHGYRFQVDEMIPLEAIATDREDGTALEIRWEVQLVHNSHIHPEWFVWEGPNPPFLEAEEHSGGLGDRYSYRVIVTATDNGGLATSREAFLIPANLPANATPVAVVSASAVTGSSPLPVLFDGTLSHDPDADVLFPSWDFGDGTGSTEIAPAHVFGGFGERVVRLTVSDVVLATASAELPILVMPGRTLACHWPFEEGGGGTALDASGHAHDAAIVGTVNASGVLGGAYRFSGFGDRVTLAAPILDERPRFTLAAWIAPEVLRAGSGIVGQRGAIALGFVAADSIGIVTGFGGEVRARYPYRAGEWHHVAATGDGTSLRLAIDGIVVATGGATTFSYGLTSDPVQVGAESIVMPQGPAFAGTIDEVRIYDDALTEDEILFLGTHPRINRAPYVSAGSDQNLIAGQMLVLEGSVADQDPLDAGALTAGWSQVSGPVAVELDDPGALQARGIMPAPGEYEFRLEAFDGELSTADEVVVSVRLYGEATALDGAPLRAGSRIDRAEPLARRRGGHVRGDAGTPARGGRDRRYRRALHRPLSCGGAGPRTLSGRLERARRRRPPSRRGNLFRDRGRGPLENDGEDRPLEMRDGRLRRVGYFK